MPRITTNRRVGATRGSSYDAEDSVFSSRMICARAEASSHSDTPMARAFLAERSPIRTADEKDSNDE